MYRYRIELREGLADCKKALVMGKAGKLNGISDCRGTDIPADERERTKRFSETRRANSQSG